VAWLSKAKRRYMTRLVAGLLAVSLPTMVGLVIVLTQSATNQLRTSTDAFLSNQAGFVAGRVDGYFAERRIDARLIVSAITDMGVGPALDAKLAELQETDPSFSLLRVADLGGNIIAAPPGISRAPVTNEDWFREAASGTDSISSSTTC